MIGDCESERIWKLIESSRSQVAVVKKKSASLTLLEHVNNACVDCNDKLQDKRFTAPVNVLDRLSGNMAAPAMIVSLLPGHEGYSVALGNNYRNTGLNSHTHHRDQMVLPYEDTELLDYLDAGQIPPVLLPLIDHTKCCQLVDGSLIVELRNYRGYQELPGKFSQQLLLLKPTAENIVAAVNHAVDVHKGTEEDGLLLESKLLLATQPPLCLDTTTDVTCVANRLQYNKHKFHTPAIRRYLKRHSQAVLTRAQMNQDAPPPKFLRLHQYIPHEAHNKVVPVSHDLSVGSLEVPAPPHMILQDITRNLPVAIVVPASDEEETTTDAVSMTTSIPSPLLMKSYDERADQYLAKPKINSFTKNFDPARKPSFLSMLQQPNIPMGVSKSQPIKILSPIEKPVPFVPQPIAGQRSSIQGTIPTASQPILISSMHQTAIPSVMQSISVQRSNIQQPTTITPVMQPISSQKTMQPAPVMQPIGSQISNVRPTVTLPVMQPIGNQRGNDVTPSVMQPTISNVQPTVTHPTMQPIRGQRVATTPPVMQPMRGQRTTTIPQPFSGQRTTATPSVMQPISGQRAMATPPALQQQQRRINVQPSGISVMHPTATPPIMQPINIQKSSVQLPVNTPTMKVSMTRPSLSMPRPIPSITSVMSTKSTEGAIPFQHTVTPIPAKLIQPPKLTAATKKAPMQPSSINSTPSAVPIMSSNISVQIVSNSNPVFNPAPVGASAITVTSSITTASAKITTSQGQRLPYPLLIRRPAHSGHAAPRAVPPIQKSAPPLHPRSSSPVPPPRPPPLRPAPRPPTLQSQKAPPQLLTGLPRMPVLHRAAPRPATPPTTTK
ncbi:transcription factor SPT20 homolog [Dysidea avara]|uniref:transcription factor SPT20 homolog n=1 Tax=Dysidea avara TaxID=196820 RepID=UPI00332F9686